MKAVAVGDLHLGKASLIRYMGEKQHFNNIYSTLDHIVAYCEHNQIEWIFQTGDVFDTAYPDWSYVERFINYLSSKPHINWRFITGNHDTSTVSHNSLKPLYCITQLNALKNVKVHFEHATEQLENWTIAYLPWPLMKTKQYSKRQINIAHETINGSTSDHGTKMQSEFEVDDNMFWIMGHLHTAHKPKSNVVYVGTPYQTKFDEQPPKFFAEVNMHDKKPSLRMIQIPQPYKLETVFVSSLKDLATVKPSKTHFYKLKFMKPITLPQVYSEYSNIIGVDGKFAFKKAEVKERDQQQYSQFTLRDHVTDFLNSRGFKQHEMRWANKFLNTCEIS